MSVCLMPVPVSYDLPDNETCTQQQALLQEEVFRFYNDFDHCFRDIGLWPYPSTFFMSYHNSSTSMPLQDFYETYTQQQASLEEETFRI